MQSELLLTVLACLAAVQFTAAAPASPQLVHFLPITQQQYDSILHMTVGKPVITEERLVDSGLMSNNKIHSSTSLDLNSHWQQLLNLTGLKVQNTLQGYPLCVIKANSIKPEDGFVIAANDIIIAPFDGRAPVNKDETSNSDDQPSVAIQPVGWSTDSINDRKHPIVNCVVVLRPIKAASDAVKPQEMIVQPPTVPPTVFKTMPVKNVLRNNPYNRYGYSDLFKGRFSANVRTEVVMKDEQQSAQNILPKQQFSGGYPSFPQQLQQQPGQGFPGNFINPYNPHQSAAFAQNNGFPLPYPGQHFPQQYPQQFPGQYPQQFQQQQFPSQFPQQFPQQFQQQFPAQFLQQLPPQLLQQLPPQLLQQLPPQLLQQLQQLQQFPQQFPPSFFSEAITDAKPNDDMTIAPKSAVLDKSMKKDNDTKQ